MGKKKIKKGEKECGRYVSRNKGWKKNNINNRSDVRRKYEQGERKNEV